MIYKPEGSLQGEPWMQECTTQAKFSGRDHEVTLKSHPQVTLKMHVFLKPKINE